MHTYTKPQFVTFGGDKTGYKRHCSLYTLGV